MKLKTFSIQRFLVPLFTFIWWKRLHVEHPYDAIPYYKRYVIQVRGWRTALILGFGGQRETVTFLFGREKIE